MLKSLLMGVLCTLWAGFSVAQPHFYIEHQKINLASSNTQFIVVAAQPALLSTVKRTDVKQYQNWPHARHAILATTVPLSPAEVIRSLGFDTDEVQVSPAYSLPDGFLLYPTPTVVFKPGDKHDLPAIEQALLGFPVKAKTVRFGTWRFELENLDQVFEAAEVLRKSGLVEFSQPDFYAPMKRHQDPLYPEQFQLHNSGQYIDGNACMDDADCNAPEAWALSMGSSAITVALLDDGLEDHEDLRDAEGNSRYIGGFTPVNGGNGDATTDAAHGMACAGIIAASHNNIGVRGVAPYVRLLSVNIFAGGETTQDVADGITWAKNQGADVLSNSWGYSSCELSFDNIDFAIADANANGRDGLGSIVVFTSGNDYYDCVSYPGNHPDVVSVGAFSSLGERSTYANYGPKLDLVAGADNVRAPGAGIRTIDRMGTGGYGFGNYITDFGGTSAAGPVVSGVAALLLGYNPTLSATALKNVLYTTATDMGPTGFDPEYGYGRVDAYAALSLAGNGGTSPTCTDGFQNGKETGTDCGGDLCTPCATEPITCTDLMVDLQIIFDHYPTETSWTLKNEAGQTLFASNSYSNEPPGGTMKQNFCLTAGCYTFTIRDSYGDGICCDFGSGNYVLSHGDSTFVSGGNFSLNETTRFCIGEDPDTTPPGSIVELTALNPTPASMDLQWTATVADTGVTNYVLLLNGEATDTTTNMVFTYEGLDSCTIYDFGVFAVDTTGTISDTVFTSEPTTGCVTVREEDEKISAFFFEQGWDGWADGGGDCYRYHGRNSFEGDYSIRLRDNSGPASTMTSPALDLSERQTINFSFYFLASSMENEESLLVSFYDGRSWQNIARYASGNDFQNGFFYQASLTLSASQHAFSDKSRFRIQCDASSNADLVYIDEVVILSLARKENSEEATDTILGPILKEGEATLTRTARRIGDESEVKIFPNPATRRVTTVADEPIKALTLLAMDGRRVKHQICDGRNRASLSVEGLPAGIYLLSVVTTEEVVVELLVVR